MQQTLCPFSTYSCPEQRQDALSPSTQARSTSARAHSIFCDSSDRPVPKLTGVNVKVSFNEGKHCLSFLSLVLHRNVWNRHPNLQSYGFKGIPLLGVSGTRFTKKGHSWWHKPASPLLLMVRMICNNFPNWKLGFTLNDSFFSFLLIGEPVWGTDTQWTSSPLSLHLLQTKVHCRIVAFLNVFHQDWFPIFTLLIKLNVWKSWYCPVVWCISSIFNLCFVPGHRDGYNPIP